MKINVFIGKDQCVRDSETIINMQFSDTDNGTDDNEILPSFRKHAKRLIFLIFWRYKRIIIKLDLEEYC